MKFLSDILAKAGLTVDGVVTLNNTATGQTPDANDNSTKLATTAWVRGFVTPYTLPIASGTTLGGIKIGSGLSIDGTGIVSVAASGVGAIRALQQITATAGQTVFTVSGGYTPGLIDVFLNGVLLTPTAIVATNGNTFTLADASVSGDLLDVFVYNPIYNGFISSTDQVPEGTINLYYTNARARLAISLTTNGVSGAASYNSSTGVLNIPNYQGLVPANGLAGQILAKASATSYDTTWIDNYTSQVQHYVKLSAAMTAGTAVYVSGSTGGSGTNMIVSKASNSSEATSSKTLGLLKTGGVTNDEVFVVTEGLLAGLDTSTATAGDPVWLGTNGGLIFGLANKPTAPAHLVFIGVVTRVQSNNGEIFVKVQNGFELDELHNLSVANASDGDMIKYVASTGLWTKTAASTTNIVEGTNLYYTDARVNTYLTTNNYATQSYVGTAISNLVDSAPTTLDTLNELAAALGDDPNFATTVATSIGTKVPLTRTITINGTSYDLSADRTWNIAAGVTSFNTRTGAITPASGDYTTAQVTESGNLYYTNTRARLAISLTTTGTSGAATYDSVTGVLNIPQYQGGVTSFNTRTGAITLSDTDVTTALTYTPVTNARTITINGTTYDLSANRTWSIAAGLTSFNTRTGDITLTSSDVTTALGYTPVTNARTLTINGTAYDLTTDRSWTVGVNPSARTIQTYTATASQTTFTVTGGYVVGLVDVFINGVRLTSSEFTATNGTTVVLATGTSVGNIVDVIKYTSAFTASSALRQVSYFTATAGQTSFTVSYTPGLVDIFYNGSKLASSEYTANNGTSIVLSSGAALNDIIEVVAYAYSVGAFTGQAQLNGTGFVKVSGTTVSYDNNTYLTTSSAASTYLPLSGGTLTGALNGTSATFSGLLTIVSAGGTKAIFQTTRDFGVNRNFQISVDEYQEGQFAITPSTTLGGSTYTTPIFTLGATGISTFSGRLTANGGISSKGGYATFEYNSSATGPVYPSYNTYFGAIGTNFSNGNSELDIWNTVGGGFVFRRQTGASAQTALLTIASSGAATFSNSVLVKKDGSNTANDALALVNAAGDRYFNWQLDTSGNLSGWRYNSGVGFFKWLGVDYTNGAATFSGNIISQGSYIDYQNTSYVRFSNSGGGTRWGYIQHNGTDLAFSNDISGGKFTFDKPLYITSSGANGLILNPDAADSNNSARLFLMRTGGEGWVIMNNAAKLSIRNGSVPVNTSGTERFSISSTGDAIATATITATTGYLGGGMYITSQGQANNTPSAPSVNIGVYNGVYAFIDLATQNIYGSWIDFSKGDGGDYAGRIRYWNQDERFVFYTAGGGEKVVITSTGNLLPGVDASMNLGSTTARWANVYTTDLHLSNKGKQNDVDGTWGDWTLQEGETEIFMLNNRSGKKYKIKLEEII